MKFIISNNIPAKEQLTLFLFRGSTIKPGDYAGCLIAAPNEKIAKKYADSFLSIYYPKRRDYLDVIFPFVEVVGGLTLRHYNIRGRDLLKLNKAGILAVKYGEYGEYWHKVFW